MACRSIITLCEPWSQNFDEIFYWNCRGCSTTSRIRGGDAVLQDGSFPSLFPEALAAHLLIRPAKHDAMSASPLEGSQTLSASLKTAIL